MVRSPANPLQAANDNLIDRTQQIWTPRRGHKVTCDDARQIAENVSGFFTILAEWAQAERAITANDNDPAMAVSGATEAAPPDDRGGRSHG